MKEKILKNIGLKILAIVCAVILWAIIVNVYDPNVGYTVSNVEVKLLNEDYLTNQGYTYSVLEGDKISVYLSGPTSVIASLNTSDIVATADLSETSLFTHYVDIKVEVMQNGENIDTVEITPKTTAVKLDIKSRTSKQFTVEYYLLGSPAENYAVSNVNLKTSEIVVSGPSDIVNQIEEASVDINVEGIKAKQEGNAELMLFDKNADAISFDQLTISDKNIEYEVQLTNAKTVKVNASTSGEPKEGYIVSKKILSTDEVVIMGSQANLEKIKSITVDSADIDITGLTADKTFDINLNKYLPEDVTAQNSNISIQVKIVPEQSRTIQLDTSMIKFNNLVAGYSATIDSNKYINVEITGELEILSKLTATDLEASVNLSGLITGKHTAAVTIKLPEGCTVVGDNTIQVTIKETGQNQTQATTKIDVTSAQEQTTTQEASVETTAEATAETTVETTDSLSLEDE